MRFYSVKEIAELFGVSKSVIYRLVRENKLTAYRVGKLIRFREDEVIREVQR